MNFMKRVAALIVTVICAMLVSCMVNQAGGGADVGNPLTGSVTMEASVGPKVSGALVILSARGADPGFIENYSCDLDDNVDDCVKSLHFLTTRTDESGVFTFDSVYPGSYVVVAAKNGLLALEYVEQRAYQFAHAELVLTEPAEIRLVPYDAFTAEAPYFKGARVAGTVFSNAVDSDGSIFLEAVPKGDLDLILYRSDDKMQVFPAFSAGSGCSSELYVDPALPESYWTPHTCTRDPLGRPYVLETHIPAVDGAEQHGAEPYDIRIKFSHDMDGLSIKKAVQGFSSDGSASVDSLWWDAGDVLYVTLCISDTTGTCRTGEDRFLQNVTYGVSIDTTAQTALGVGFACEERVTFTP